ncbi:MAG: hypothetical protein M1837_002854 [Sclerophora amabilis]|nr:MAG: hypothetical protein M1837_002854 [Sclerophora amabilis]
MHFSAVTFITILAASAVATDLPKREPPKPGKLKAWNVARHYAPYPVPTGTSVVYPTATAPTGSYPTATAPPVSYPTATEPAYPPPYVRRENAVVGEAKRAPIVPRAGNVPYLSLPLYPVSSSTPTSAYPTATGTAGPTGTGPTGTGPTGTGPTGTGPTGTGPTGTGPTGTGPTGTGPTGTGPTGTGGPVPTGYAHYPRAPVPVPAGYRFKQF